MDTLVGKFTLTPNQQTHLSKINGQKVKGYAYWHDSGELVVVSESKLSDQEIKGLNDLVSSFPDTVLDSISIEKLNKEKRTREILRKIGIDHEEFKELFEAYDGKIK